MRNGWTPVDAATSTEHLPPELAWAADRFRPYALDGALLLFDRETGWTVHGEGPETAHLRRVAPRLIQFGITSRCNLTCGFCSRELHAPSAWTAETAFDVLSALADAGSLEVAFGGGEPLVFPGFDELVRRLHDETPLGTHVTTNGLLLTERRLATLAPHVGEFRLSLYEDNDWEARVGSLSRQGVRFGTNWLVTPTNADSVPDRVLDLVDRGCRDILLLGYTGPDRSLHLGPNATRELADTVRALGAALRGAATLKLDVCWGDRMEPVPRAIGGSDCGAGRDFVVITSDRQLQPCSFHHDAIPFRDGAELLEIWRRERPRFREPAATLGCARLPGGGLAEGC